MTEKKTSVDDIIGIVKTDEQTNSVQLKKEAQLSICEKRVLELERENEQLKKQIQQLRTDNTKQKKLLNTTIKQNRHTTTTIQTMMENERTELGRSVLRQLWEAIQ